MTDKHTQAHVDESNIEKDPEQWVTGDEPMTGAQRSYLDDAFGRGKGSIRRSANEGASV